MPRSAVLLCIWLVCALMSAGCGRTKNVTLYLPEGDGLKTAEERIGDQPRDIIDALVHRGVLPEVDWDYLYCASYTSEDGVETVQLDIADALGDAIAALPNDALAVQALVNSYLDYYDAELMLLSVEGTNLQSLGTYYDHGIVFDEYAATREG